MFALWLQSALPWIIGWLVTVSAIFVVGFAIALLAASVRAGSLTVGVRNTFVGLAEGIRDIVLLPFGVRRIWAVTALTFRESVRRRVLYVFVMFFIPLLFAGWYLPNRDEGQLIFLVAFVSSAIKWLLFPLAIFIVSMSFPNDLKHRTIQTVVTKPIRRSEIVVGRILGFMGIFTAVLAVMAGVGLLYLRSQISEEVFANQWKARVRVLASAPGDVEAVDGRSYPLMFRRKGQLFPSGRNVGREVSYQSHIEGQTSEEAIWFFSFDPTLFQDRGTVTAELMLDIFKTTKGDPYREGAEGSGVYCNMEFRDPVGGNRHTEIFRVDHRRRSQLLLPSSLFENGKLRVVATCMTRNQFLGMAPEDLYFLADEAPFEVNFFKGIYSIWLTLLLLCCVAVAASTVLNGFVTVLFTAMVYVIGIFYGFMIGVIHGEVLGGGPIESFIRVITQDNQMTPLTPGPFTDLALTVDKGVLWMMERLSRVVPNLTSLDTIGLVAKGVDISPPVLIATTTVIFGYVIPVVIVGYFLLKSREIAA